MVWVARIVGVAFGIAGVTVVDVVAVLAVAATVDVPLAQVLGGVTEPLEVFADRVVSGIEAAQRRGLEHELARVASTVPGHLARS